MHVWDEGMWASSQPWLLEWDEAGITLRSSDGSIVISCENASLGRRMSIIGDCQFTFDGRIFLAEKEEIELLWARLPRLPIGLQVAPKTQGHVPRFQRTNYGQRFSSYGFFVGMAAMLALPRGGGIIGSFLIGAVCGVGGSGLGLALGLFVDALGESCGEEERKDTLASAIVSVTLGTVTLLAWLLPVAGIPISIAGFALGRRGRTSSIRTLALTGMGLNLFGLILSVVNGYLGALIMMRNVL
jgi:hypothetical protein